MAEGYCGYTFEKQKISTFKKFWEQIKLQVRETKGNICKHKD